MRCRNIVDVAGGVLDLLNKHRVDDDAELLHLTVATVLDLLGQPVAFANDLLDSQAADDRPQMAGENAPDEFFHTVLLGEKTSRCVRDGRRVVTDLESGDCLDVQPDALRGDALFSDLRLM